MNIIIYLIAGGIVGYIASRIMHTNSQQGLLLDIVVGVVGAFLAGYFISPCLVSGRSTMPSPFQPCWSPCWVPSFCCGSIRRWSPAADNGNSFTDDLVSSLRIS